MIPNLTLRAGSISGFIGGRSFSCGLRGASPPAGIYGLRIVDNPLYGPVAVLVPTYAAHLSDRASMYIDLVLRQGGERVHFERNGVVATWGDFFHNAAHAADWWCISPTAIRGRNCLTLGEGSAGLIAALKIEGSVTVTIS